MGSYRFLWVPIGSCSFLWVPIGSYGPGRTWRGLDKPKQTRTDQDRPRQTRTDPDRPRRTWMGPDGPGQNRTDPDGPGRTRTDPDGPGRTRTDPDAVQESSELVKIRLLILYSESYTIIGDFCPKPFGLFYILFFEFILCSLALWKYARPCFFARMSKVIFALLNLCFAYWVFWMSWYAKYQNHKIWTSLSQTLVLFGTTCICNFIFHKPFSHNWCSNKIIWARQLISWKWSGNCWCVLQTIIRIMSNCFIFSSWPDISRTGNFFKKPRYLGFIQLSRYLKMKLS